MRYLLVVFFLGYSLVLLAEVDTLSITENTILEIKNGKEIFGNKSDWWDKYSSGLIAMVTVFVSLGISVWQAKKTTQANRANSISEARIQWIQELRPLLSELISGLTLLKYQVDVLKNLNKKNLPPEVYTNIKEIDKIYARIKLYLNKSEKEHAELLSLTDHFLPIQHSLTKTGDNLNDFNVDNYTKLAQKVLKSAWEQAKNEK